MKKILLVSLLSCFSLSASAHEHRMGTVKGEEVELKYYDHAVAGSVRDALIYAFIDESHVGSKLHMRFAGLNVETRFNRSAQGEMSLMLSSANEQTLRHTVVALKAVDTKQQTLTLDVDGNAVVVQITADKFENKHFQNPTYSLSYKGKQMSFKMDGEACYTMSSHLLLWLVGSYVHTL